MTIKEIIESIESDFLARLKVVLDDLSPEQRLSLAYQIDVVSELQELGYMGIITQIESDYSDMVNEVLKEADSLGVRYSQNGFDFVNEIYSLQESYIGKTFSAHSDLIKQNVILGIVAGDSTQSIVNNLRSTGLPATQIQSLVDTTKDRLKAGITAKIYEDEPGTRFILDGVQDARNRCECRAVLLNQPKEGWTKAEIDSGAATNIVKQFCPQIKPESQEYTWTGRGGYNCRHFWTNVEFKNLANS